MHERSKSVRGEGFETDMASILDRVESIDPIAYGRTRNFIDGAVTRLSPYISRGVISTRFVMDRLYARGYKAYQMEKLLQELAWRDYFQRIGQERPDLTERELRNPQQDVDHYKIPKAVLEADTGIEAVDASIRGLYETGYMHNHFRMYTASIVCNVGKSHWAMPARWMYHHLLDADFASNACSWQWVCAAFSSKRYYANQENINRYGRTAQRRTFLDQDYDGIMSMEIPDALKETEDFAAATELPKTQVPDLDADLPILIYNAYNLDPSWRSEELANRVLLLEPSHFERHSMSSKTIGFIMALSQNIPGIKVFTGEFEELRKANPTGVFVYREHPLFRHYTGVGDEREWMFPSVSGWHNSFFAFWKRCERLLPR
jgi:deoxyribodipyrimidine photo-lyase